LIDRAALERHQVWGYLAAIALGLALGTAAPAVAPAFEAVLWPVLGLLLYATFTQVPLVRVGAALGDGRFVAAVLGGNFLAVPLLVAALLPLVPDDAAVRLGVVLVLVVPCTDWFITFTHLARGDAARAIAVTPLILLAQLLLLPGYVWLLVGEGVTAAVPLGHVATAFGALIGLPLALAFATERRAERDGRALIERLAWAPVPLLAVVVFLIAASQAGTVVRALPPSWQAASIVIVAQSLVELFGMLAFLRLVPRLLPER